MCTVGVEEIAQLTYYRGLCGITSGDKTSIYNRLSYRGAQRRFVSQVPGDPMTYLLDAMQYLQ